MNGIEALGVAVGQDTRSLSAGVHSYSVYKYGQYRCLTEYEIVDGKYLKGELSIPLTMGTKGGVLSTNPAYRVNLKILNVTNANDLCIVAVCLGLA